MFDKNKFAQIIKNIKETYSSQEEFSKKSGIGRTYLSQYMNMKLDLPPSPKVLIKIANSSHNLISYEELMEICGYIEKYSLSPSELLALDYERDKLKKEKEEAIEELNLTYDEHKIYTSLCMLINYEENIEIQLNDILKDYNEYSEESKNKIKKAFDINIIYREKEHALTEKLLDSLKPEESKFFMAPVYGHISAGQPNWAEECIEGRIPIDPELMNIVNPEECFFLRVNGESMNKIVKNGAYALIRKTDFVENGEIAVVLVNGYDATLKKFSRQGDLVILEPQSTDSSYETQVYGKETEVKIIGKYIGKMEMK